MLYLRSMSIQLIICLLVTNFLMQGSRTLIDFWLRSEVTPGSTKFDSIDSYFDNSFNETLTFFIIVNLLITFIRNLFYVICA